MNIFKWLSTLFKKGQKNDYLFIFPNTTNHYYKGRILLNSSCEDAYRTQMILEKEYYLAGSRNFEIRFYRL
jgi:hypothetical protein